MHGKMSIRIGIALVITAFGAGLTGCVTSPRPAPTILVYFNEQRIIETAEKAIRAEYPGIWLSDYKLSQILCIQRPTLDPSYVEFGKGSDFTVRNTAYLARMPDRRPPRLYVEWLGVDPIEVVRGETRYEDRKKVQKLRVIMTGEGHVQDVTRSEVWLERAGREKGLPDAVFETPSNP